MSKEKMPPEEGKDDSKGYVEIDLSRLKEKLADGYERLVFGHRSRKFDGADKKGEERTGLDGIRDRIKDRIAEGTAAEVKRDMQIMEQAGRVGLSPSYARAGYAFAVFSLLLVAVMIWVGADVEGFLLASSLFILSVALIFLGKYEIRYDEEGFSTRLGKKVLRRYAWSDVTDVFEDTSSRFHSKRVIVRGKKLFADASMNGFEPFYIRARRQIKGGGKTVPSEKKRKNRKKTGK